MTDRRPPFVPSAVARFRFVDLVATAALAVVLAAATLAFEGADSLAAEAAGTVAGGSTGSLAAALAVLPLVAVLPGYAVVACLAPVDRSVPRPLVVVPVASLSLATLVTVGLRVAPVDVTAGALAVSLAFVTVALAAVAGVRRRRGTAGRPVDWSAAGRSADGRDVPVAFLAVTALVLVVAVAYVGVLAPPTETFSTLSVSPADGDVTIESLALDPGEETALDVAVENQEGERVAYTLVAQVEVVRTAGNETTILGTQSSERFETTLADGERWTTTHAVSPEPVPGRQRVAYYLYRGSAPSDPGEDTAYRTAVVWEPVEDGTG